MKEVTSATRVLGPRFFSVPPTPPIHAYNLHYTMAIFELNVDGTTKLVMTMVYKRCSSAINITKEE